MKIKFAALASFLLAVIISCGTSTVITGSWMNKTNTLAGKNYNSVFIACMLNDLGVKRAIENSFYDQAVKRGLKATRSYEIFMPNFNDQNAATKLAMIDQIKATGAQTILTIVLKSSESQTRYVPGSVTYDPVPFNNYYGNFYGYYNNYYSEVYTPGYYANDKIYFVECNLYDAASEDILWSAQTKTTNPANVESAAREYAAVIVSKMKKDGLLTK